MSLCTDKDVLAEKDRDGALYRRRHAESPILDFDLMSAEPQGLLLNCSITWMEVVYASVAIAIFL